MGWTRPVSKMVPEYSAFDGDEPAPFDLVWAFSGVTQSMTPVSYLFDEAPFQLLTAALANVESGESITVTNSGAVNVLASGTASAVNSTFDIVIHYSGNPTYQAAFTQAVARWTQIIIADIPDFNSSQYGFIDDLLIDASIVAIDGPGGILGQAGPDVLRNGSLLPAHGVMQFDSADVAQMFSNGTWGNVILHEMGHILGVGTLWNSLHLKNGAGDYIGARGLAEYRVLAGNPGATSVPVERNGGSGTAGAHWSEQTFNAELMTGFIESAGIPMPISRLTVGSLQDIGYAVNYAAADFYSLPITGSNIIMGDALDNVLNGTSGNDTMFGLGGNDTLNGLAGHDTLDGGVGNDILNGGVGDDLAIFTGSLASYTLLDLGVGIRVSGPDGNDTLFSVEHLRFADGTINPDDGSGVFDTVFYDTTSPDVFHAGVDAKGHYNSSGWREGRDPNAFFSTSDYLDANPDVRAAGINPLDHYHQTGWKQGRDPSPIFDVGLYLANNPDVAAAGMDPLEHYLLNGRAEGRAIYAAIGTPVGGFDAEYYLFSNPDVARAGINPLSHYNNDGWHEGRNPNAYFDTAGYLAHNPDVVAAGINPLLHYELYGWREGRDPSTAFDTAHYLAAYPDVVAAHIGPLDHYLQNGIYEGRSAFADGVWH